MTTGATHRVGRPARRRAGARPAGQAGSRNHLRAVVTEVKADGPTVQIEMVIGDPARIVVVVPRASLEHLDLRPGMAATALVNPTSIIVQQ